MELVNAALGVILLALVVFIGYKAGMMVVDLNSPAVSAVNTTNFTVNVTPITTLTLRWNHSPLTVYMNTSFIQQNPQYVDDAKLALALWQSSTNNLVSFQVTNDPNADIRVNWVDNLPKGKSTDTLGNTDLRFLNVSWFGLIGNATIELLTKEGSLQLNDVDMTNLALHELGHAVGLSHTSSESDIMYPVLTIPSSAIKKISPSDLQHLKDAYALPAEPDLVIAEANVTKVTLQRLTTIYLVNISMTIENDGLQNSPATNFQVTADGTTKQEDIPSIPVGTSLNIFLGNLRVDNDFKTVQLVIDPSNSITELNKQNNNVTLTVS